VLELGTSQVKVSPGKIATSKPFTFYSVTVRGAIHHFDALSVVGADVSNKTALIAV